MKFSFLLLALVSVIASPRLARAHWPPREARMHCEEPQGFHEYAIFGGSGGSGPFYLYHYPAFGSIHAYEVVEEVALFDETGNDLGPTLATVEQANPGRNFTVSPLNPTDGSDAYWVLPAYTHARAQFTAHVHYRNAQGQDTDALPRVHVVVRDVAVDQLLKTPFTRPANLTYTYLESGDSGYLVHKLVWDPDFNQILRVRPIAEAQSCLQHGGAELTVTGVAEGEANRLRAGQSPAHATICGQSVTVTATGELFEFKADLEH